MYFWSIRDQAADAAGLDHPAIDEYMLRLNLGLIARNPTDYAAAVGTAATNYVLPSYSDTSAGGHQALEVLYLLGHTLVAAGFAVQMVGMVGLYAARRLGTAVDGPFSDRAARRVWLYSLGVVLYTGIVSVTIEAGYARYRAPTDPLILVVASGGLWMCWNAFSRQRRPRGVEDQTLSSPHP